MSELKFININDRRIIEGPVDKLMQISPVKYDKPMRILDTMMRNNWFHWDVDLSDDSKQWPTLPDKIREAVRKALGALSNLDGIQLGNLTNNIGRYVTSPEYSMALCRQAWEEGVHVLSYQTMVETYDMDPVATYNLFMTDDLLKTKNEHILAQSAILGDDYSAENFALSIVANIALEGIYFNSGFKLFYVLHRQGMLPQTAKMIRYINRDEVSHHLRLFHAMWEDLRQERSDIFTPEVATKARKILENAARMEIAWGQHIVDGGIPGMSPDVVDQHVKYLTDFYSKNLDLGPIFNQTHDPLAWCEAYMREHGVDTNFFEDKPIEYEDKSLDW